MIVDGACRDINESHSYGFTVFARATTPRTARGRLRQKSTGEAVSIAGITVQQGDLVVADDSGVVFIPRRSTSAVLDEAEQIVARESAIATDIRADIPINRAMHDARLAGHNGSDGHTHQVPTPIDRLAALPTATISDALGPPRRYRVSARHRAPARRAPRRRARLHGEYEPVDGSAAPSATSSTTCPRRGDRHRQQGRTDCTVWGGIMTRAAAARGIAGTVIHGSCRDVPSVPDVGYPMWSTARFMRTGKDSVRLRAVQVPLLVDGVTIHPGTGSAPTQTAPWSCPPTASTKSSKPHSASSAPKRPSPTPSSPDHPDAGPRHHGYHALQTTTAKASAANNTTNADPANEDHQSSTTTARDAARGRCQRHPVRASERPSPSTRASRPRGPVPACAGPAFTVQGAGGDNLALHLAVIAAPAGSVLVVDVGGAPLRSLGRGAGRGRPAATASPAWSSTAASATRDDLRDSVPGVLPQQQHPSAPASTYAGLFGEAVTSAGSPSHTGDLIVGDADGVVAIPQADLAEVLDEADRRVTDEHRHR